MNTFAGSVSSNRPFLPEIQSGLRLWNLLTDDWSFYTSCSNYSEILIRLVGLSRISFCVCLAQTLIGNFEQGLIEF